MKNRLSAAVMVKPPAAVQHNASVRLDVLDGSLVSCLQEVATSMLLCLLSLLCDCNTALCKAMIWLAADAKLLHLTAVVAAAYGDKAKEQTKQLVLFRQRAQEDDSQAQQRLHRLHKDFEESQRQVRHLQVQLQFEKVESQKLEQELDHMTQDRCGVHFLTCMLNMF